MSQTISAERLDDLLVDLREDLDLEVKNWLDLRGNSHHKAIFAKAALALANHGGGFIVLGFEETGAKMEEAANRPATLDTYNQDVVNGVVQKYCDPQFHCAVHIVANLDGAKFPIVRIPGGHRVPVRARRARREGKVLDLNAIYIRKPGPRSEPPQSSQEWDDLLSRCLRNRREELLDMMRDLSSGAGAEKEPAGNEERLERWIVSCFDRWRSLTDPLPEGAGPRFQHGYFNFAYEIVGDVRQITLGQLPELIRSSAVRHTGWPPFWYPTREGIEPYPRDGAVECWLGGDPKVAADRRDPAHSDFWRITPDGCAYLLRGYQEDVQESMYTAPAAFAPGTVFDITLPVWRAGETLLQAEHLASILCEGPAVIRFAAEYTGLGGRSLVSLSGRRYVREGSVSRQESTRLHTHIESQAIGTRLPEIVHTLLSPLYELFGFFELPMQLVVDELRRMREGSF